MLHRHIVELATTLLLIVEFMRHHITKSWYESYHMTDVNSHRNTYLQSNITYDLEKPCYIIYCLTEIKQLKGRTGVVEV